MDLMTNWSTDLSQTESVRDPVHAKRKKPADLGSNPSAPTTTTHPSEQPIATTERGWVE